MKHPLCLDFLTAVEASPPELVTLAASNGCEYVSILVHPAQGLPDYGMNTASPMRRETLNRCRSMGIAIDMVEGFFLTPETDIADYRSSLESSQRLGAQSVNVLLRDPDRSRLRDRFAAFCDLTGDHGMTVITEWSIRSPFASPGEAIAFLTESGQPIARIALDSLHLFRAGFTAADVAALNPEMIARGQLSDGPAEMPDDRILAEAFSERLPPGEGVLPLASFVDALPGGVVIGLEVPMDTKRSRGVSAADRVRCVAEAARSAIPSLT